MSIGDWVRSAAARGVLIGACGLVVLAGALYFVWEFWPDPLPPRTVASVSLGSEADYLGKNLDADCLALLAVKPEPDPTPKQTEDCADKATAQKYNYASLEQAVRSADAAMYSAYIGRLQTCLGIVGALLVLATLTASAGATFAGVVSARGTIKAADATRKSVELGLRQISLTHRPRLHVRRVRLVIPKDASQPITVGVRVANVGAGDAIIIAAHYWVNFRTQNASDGSEPLEEEAGIRFLKAGESMSLDRKAAAQNGDHIWTNVSQLVVRGLLVYSDTFPGSTVDRILDRVEFKSTRRSTAFERVYAGPLGGDEYRYVRADKPDPEREYED